MKRLLLLVVFATLAACGARTPSRDGDCRFRRDRPDAYMVPWWNDTADSRKPYRAKCSLACDHALCDEVFCCPPDFRP